MRAQPLSVPAIGSAERADRLAREVQAAVPAYRRFLEARGFPADGPFGLRPLTDKKSYLTAQAYDELLAAEFDQTFAIFASSGSSGQAFYWPQLKDSHRTALPNLRAFLEQTFAIHQRRTLAVVGLALGSWIGGEHLSWLLKSLALACPYPLAVFSPGNRHDEIIRMARRAERFVDQIVLFVCPSAIAHLFLLAERLGTPLPVGRMRYVVLGESFPEFVRAQLHQRAGVARTENLLFSVYGSADTGVLGAESPASVAVRRLLSENPALNQELAVGPVVPHLFHAAAADAYLEDVSGELCVTRSQGIPLVRYNLHDAVSLWSWTALRRAVLESPHLRPEDDDLRAVIAGAGEELPDLLAVRGRADRTLILCGTNLTEAMLDQAIKSSSLATYLTGCYRARVAYDGDRQRLEFDLELRAGVASDSATMDAVYGPLLVALGEAQPEFRDDWQNVYRAWDDDPARRILRLNGVLWPRLSQPDRPQIKQRGIEP
jgi:phenylacetate-CoA ligase